MKSFILICFLCFLASSLAEITPNFPPTQPVVVNPTTGSGIISGVVLPGDIHYWRIESFNNVQVDDYLVIDFNQTGEARAPADRGNLWVIRSNFTDLQSELSNNNNIVDTLGELPGPKNNHYKCALARCIIEINCEFTNGTYYLGIGGGDQALVRYNFTVFRRDLNVTALNPRGVAFFDDSRRRLLNEVGFVVPPPPSFPDRSLHYRFYEIDVPASEFSEGTYLIVNISRVEPFPAPTLRLNYLKLPMSSLDTGLGGVADEKCFYPFCVNTSMLAHNEPFSEHPVRNHPRVGCECVPQVQSFPGGSFQLTCNLTVDPCRFQYGKWYASVELLPSTNLFNPIDTSAQTNYTLRATIVRPTVSTLFQNVTFKGFVEPERVSHYKIVVNENEIVEGRSHFFVHINNIRGGSVDVWVHGGQGVNSPTRNLAGGPEACVPANATCRTSDACNLVIEKCHFTAGTWYISVNVAFIPGTAAVPAGRFLVDDFNRLPITYTIRANWMLDPEPQKLLAGSPVHKFIGEGLYDFYVIDVPATIDTWLFVELYVQSNDTEVILSMLHGDIPGGECYARPDFYCLTGDPRGTQVPTFAPQNQLNTIVSRESCTFMIQTCELEAGPLYLSVYGHRLDYSPYGNTTFYEVPVHYTLWADFDVALSIESEASYSEHIREQQYNHYYIRADNINEGASLSVEVTNIQHGVPQSLEVFVNYNFLAGNCPCYDHLYNCTGSSGSNCGAHATGVNANLPNFVPGPNTVTTACTIVVPPCDFRSGVWYIAVLGVNEDLAHFKTPIGYTLTATIIDAPTVAPLIVGSHVTDQVQQFNTSLQYNHYKLAAQAIPLHDLVFNLVYVQNSEYKAKHDNVQDQLHLYVNRGAFATSECADFKCTANITGSSYCNVVVPHCQWQSDTYYLSVKGDFGALFDARYTLRASVEEVVDHQLADGVSTYGRAPAGRYVHYFIDVTPNTASPKHLMVDIYTNSDQDQISARLNIDERAGGAPCFKWLKPYQCNTTSSCAWQIEACELTRGRYYISVYGQRAQFYDISVEHTITATLQDSVRIIERGDPLTGHININQIQHFRYDVQTVNAGEALVFNVENVKHGIVTAYLNFGSAAGKCPCYKHFATCTADSENIAAGNKNWCELRVPSCKLRSGSYFLSVVGVQHKTPSPPTFITPIGYTLEVNPIAPAGINTDITVELDRQVSNTVRSQTVSNGQYRHFGFTVDDDDFETQGYQVIVEVTNVQDGALFVYYNPNVPADEHDGCHVAKICSTGLSVNRQCKWQMPFCLMTPGRHFISVEGVTGRKQARFDILIWQQRPLRINENPNFVIANNTNFPAGTEVRAVHDRTNEPLGWSQFFVLRNVELKDPEGGDILEVFFYNIINNAGQSTSFNVYLWPERPAGAAQCCSGTPSAKGACQNAPCLRHVRQTTTSTLDADEATVFTCSNAVGVGAGTTPFFGQRCTVRVWGCEFAKQHPGLNKKRDWWLTVVPVTATSPTVGTLAGLTYNVQWRVRNTRINTAGAIQSSTTISTNGNLTQVFGFTGFEEMRSYKFDITVGSSEKKRLIVQTVFNANTTTNDAIVYIQPGSHANPNGCNKYLCPSFANNLALNTAASCSCASRYINGSCCVRTDTYYITVRNRRTLNANTNPIAYQFRVTLLTEAATVAIPDNRRVTSQFNVVSNVATGAGVDGENYRHYRLDVDDSDHDFRSLVVLLSKTDADTNDVKVFVRAGHEAGEYAPNLNQAFYGTPTASPEGCYTSFYSCLATGLSGRCLLQVPHCQLFNRDWYISVYNPNFDCTRAAAARSFRLQAYFDVQPRSLTLGTTLTVPQTTPVGLGVKGLYVHYKVDVSRSDLAFDQRDIVQSYYTKFLRFTLTNVTLGQVDFYVNYDDVAGNSADSSCSCLKAFSTVKNCTNNCIVDVNPCIWTSPFKLVTGTYYASVFVHNTAAYQLTAAIQQNTFTTLPPVNSAGAGHRAGTDNVVYTVTPSAAQLTAQTDALYRYTFDVSDESGEDDDDDISSRSYFIANITTRATPAAVNVKLNIWRDDCERWECTVNTQNGFCVADAVQLGTCSSKGGRFYIRVDNPARVNFTLNMFHNESTTQRIVNNQTLTEIVYPYEYEQYFYRANNVGDGSTFTVTLTAIIGDVEAWILPDTHAGPGPDASGLSRSCSIDYCRTTAGAGQHTLDNSNAKCQLFLDTCTFEQRGYWIAVRGVSTEFPAAVNSNLYLAAKYHIHALQTFVNFTEMSFSNCAHVVEYPRQIWSVIPQQFVFDLETSNLGASLRFSLRLPRTLSGQNILPASNAIPQLYVSRNRSVGYSPQQCSNLPYTCQIAAGQRECHFIIPSCAVKQGRHYIWADAPRGSEVLVERFDPIIPTLSRRRAVHTTISGPDSGQIWDQPYKPARQYFKIDEFGGVLDEAFHLRIRITNVTQGELKVWVNSVGRPSNEWLPIDSDNSCPKQQQLVTTCNSVHKTQDCLLEIHRCALVGADQFNPDPHYPYAFFVTVEGVQQECELHSIKYTIEYDAIQTVKRAEINSQFCDHVDKDEYSWYRLSPRTIETPQRSILRVSVIDVDTKGPEEVSLSIQDGALGTDDCNVGQVRSNVLVGSGSLDYICGYRNLHIGVHGLTSNAKTLHPNRIDYCLNVTKVIVPVTQLEDNKAVRVDDSVDDDDDDDEQCPTPHDFYVFQARSDTPERAYLNVKVLSEFATTVYVQKASFAWTTCHDLTCSAAATTNGQQNTCEVNDFCKYENTLYYVTVVSQGPYDIVARVIDDRTKISLGDSVDGRIDVGEYKIYTLNVESKDFNADDRLVVDVGDIYYGDVQAWVRRGKLPGVFSNSTAPNVFSCVEATTGVINFQPSCDSSHEDLVVNHCSLKAGTYYIVVKGIAKPGRQCRSIRFNLRPEIKSLGLKIDQIQMGTAKIADQVDLYNVLRTSSRRIPRFRYYVVNSVRRDSHNFAVFRLFDVSDGSLRLRVKKGHLSSSSFAFFDGENHGTHIVPNHPPYSGRRPATLQRILDGAQTNVVTPVIPTPTIADGCRDLYCDTGVDEVDQYIRDKSCAIWFDSCHYGRDSYYMVVEVLRQDYEDRPVTFSLAASEKVDFRLLSPDKFIDDRFAADNWDYHFYAAQQPDGVESLRIRVQVLSGEGVLVTLRDAPCDKEAEYIREVWCDFDYIKNDYMCDIEIPTKAAHPGRNTRTFYATVQGKNATYAIVYWKGRQNCHSFNNDGSNEGLDFCAGAVPYTTWRWSHYDHLDSQARCLFNELYQHFKVQPCWSGVTPECNSTLRNFACFESFRRCDAQGFQVPTCRKACEAVVYECVNHFETVDLEHYNCTSSYYVDGDLPCTGHRVSDTFNNAQFLEDVDVVLFESRSSPDSAASALSASLSVFFVALVALFFALN